MSNDNKVKRSQCQTIAMSNDHNVKMYLSCSHLMTYTLIFRICEYESNIKHMTKMYL